MKVSYNTMIWGSTGTVFRQRVRMSLREFEAICDAIRCEIAMDFPQKDKYSHECEAVLREYFKPPTLEKFEQPYLKNPLTVAYLTLTQARYLCKYEELKSRLKFDRNTYLLVEGVN